MAFILALSVGLMFNGVIENWSIICQELSLARSYRHELKLQKFVLY